MRKKSQPHDIRERARAARAWLGDRTPHKKQELAAFMAIFHPEIKGKRLKAITASLALLLLLLPAAGCHSQPATANSPGRFQLLTGKTTIGNAMGSRDVVLRMDTATGKTEILSVADDGTNYVCQFITVPAL